jgi:uncharacterized protein (DUF2236 family)
MTDGVLVIDGHRVREVIRSVVVCVHRRVRGQD